PASPGPGPRWPPASRTAPRPVTTTAPTTPRPAGRPPGDARAGAPHPRTPPAGGRRRHDRRGAASRASPCTTVRPMGILGWILVGLIAGALAGWITGKPQGGCLATMVVGIVGALIGGTLWRLATGDDSSLNSFGLGSIAVAIVGAVLLVLVLE